MVKSVLRDWRFEVNYDFSELEKIWVLWHPSVAVTVISKSLQMMTCLVLFPAATISVAVSFVYASTFEEDRRALWSEIIMMSQDQQLHGVPWSIMGDFNQIVDASEHSNGIVRSRRGVREIKD